eukprot:CAMPEP_0182456280 /NCGR_PEP_ID=MMETSP1319-20130603/2164_1 /TAXON_ID=172717 /ORGANISM="Bolidomonas pacifica, Strain RCC208" /LENGTH=64 /DNA_ID=CAMNT_0024654491 /DNA_START=59 /DNA_END=253 /DNA_ORIENTATION=+
MQRASFSSLAFDILTSRTVLSPVPSMRLTTTVAGLTVPCSSAHADLTRERRVGRQRDRMGGVRV